MDVIKITPDELRTLASAAEMEAEFNDMRKRWERWHGPSGYHLEKKLIALAEKLESEKREALEFIPAKGVQA
ncbi:MAG: hypothetical protein CL550_06445 [Alcanivorax sp.]|uniref:hypothetical protein n=1 Tax=Alcanivorax sp. TaxID=1872427 RepID=UPI000C4F59B5|nr:hypothetical protein [Alcanivorax sp.]MBB10568.1 hypothetical protein [Alcanivorax sp.]MBU84023.1 hypothetical protein [Alcanivorax sp.]|tara:strand:- start:152 stop:367 length:216 start_codon:yes stop_codon:yes gene_type:complete